MKLAIKLQNIIDNETGFCLQYRPQFCVFNLSINGNTFNPKSEDELIKILSMFEEEEDDL